MSKPVIISFKKILNKHTKFYSLSLFNLKLGLHSTYRHTLFFLNFFKLYYLNYLKIIIGLAIDNITNVQNFVVFVFQSRMQLILALSDINRFPCHVFTSSLALFFLDVSKIDAEFF